MSVLFQWVAQDPRRNIANRLVPIFNAWFNKLIILDIPTKKTDFSMIFSDLLELIWCGSKTKIHQLKNFIFFNRTALFTSFLWSKVMLKYTWNCNLIRLKPFICYMGSQMRYKQPKLHGIEWFNHIWSINLTKIWY